MSVVRLVCVPPFWDEMNSRKHPIFCRNLPSPNAANTSPVNFRHVPPKTHLSARKLAARLWHFRRFQHESSPLLRERKSGGDSVASVLLSELLRAQTCIKNLKAQQKKLCEEKENLRKTEAMLEDLRDKLARERRSRERMESLNTKLVHDLAEAKLYAKQFRVNYEEEKRKREVIEEVCNELAMQVGEDKAKLAEMEEERNMFQMAELWRQESIQMKLLDAKLALEDKYNQMIHLISLLQRSRGHQLGSVDSQLIKQAVESVNVERVAKPSFDFTKSNHVFSVFEDLKIKERVIQVEPYYPSSSTVHIVSLDEDYCINEDENEEDGCYKHCEGRLNTSSVQRGGIASGESGFKQWELLGQPNFAESVNPHITRGMKGCIEWPRGIPKINSKVIIPLEERVRKQKSQLQHILKPQA